MPAKRIAIDARFYRKSTAGAGRYTRGLIHHLQKLNSAHNFTVILTPQDAAEWPKEATLPNWRPVTLPTPHYSLAEQTKLYNYLSRERFDLVHFTQFNHPIRYNRPFVVTILDLIMTKFPVRSAIHPYSLAYKTTMRHAATRSERIFVPSESTSRDVQSLLKAPASKIVLTPCAAEPEFQPSPDSPARRKLLESLGITKPFILFVNAWRPHKGLPELIAAFQTIKQTHDYQLVIVGKPAAAYPGVATTVRDAQTHTPDILTPGFISDEAIIHLYNTAAAFVFPSHYEGFGLGALEAISCGCPTIAARNSSLPEVLGSAAEYFTTGDAQDLAGAIARVIDYPERRAELRQLGLTQAKQFSFDAMAAATLRAYQDVLSNQ